MPKKDTKLEQLLEKIHITVEELRDLGVENLDHMFLKIYTEQASQITDSRQQEKAKHLLESCIFQDHYLESSSFAFSMSLSYNTFKTERITGSSDSRFLLILLRIRFISYGSRFSSVL